ncbi:hypothetical protein CMV_026869 [Castanea mollissima]|uniref:CCHC-type domain-containing protein n=1 Tax=Castanea mollissima TaxID=60419 RepID=A0A8J4QJ78_9ROSI|nr:hypothetical protein CMV_026869 [Castanea mollissima]
MFSFKHEANVRRAWDRRPWTVKGEHLILKRFCSDISVSEVDFSTTEFWIQIHGLPLNRRSKENVLKIGSIAGKALDTNLVGPGSGILSKCVRVRVEMDISCPLVPGFPLERDHLPVLWIPFKFEKLGNFCFGCGMLGHDHRNCQDKGVQVLLSEGVNFGFFGKWLRADNDEFQPGKDCLCVNVLREKYKIRNNWLTHSYSGHASPFWKSLLGIKHLFSKAACILLGNGDSIRIWSDPWIPDLPGFIPSPKVDANPDLALVVSQLLSSDHSRWDIPKLNYFFEEPVVDLIMKIPIPLYQTEDSWSWIVTNSGSFSVKSAYWLCRAAATPSNIDAIRGQIWKTKLHERHRMHLWRIAANVLPSKEVWIPPSRLDIKINVDAAVGPRFSAIAAVLLSNLAMPPPWRIKSLCADLSFGSSSLSSII